MTISFDDFKKIELRVGEIKSAEPIAGSEKLLKLTVDFGELGQKQILAGLAQNYASDSLVGIKAVFVFNLEPRNFMGLESQGLILAADGVAGPVILTLVGDITPGSMVK